MCSLNNLSFQLFNLSFYKFTLARLVNFIFFDATQDGFVTRRMPYDIFTKLKKPQKKSEKS
ncbi:hypothetical protein C4D60_Mb00t16210 [Musa balbisiana]|uniref:Uncharacterized protein n=1 Tax=Musa balbisiana TaxID=52838 RepID=A0A4S8I3I7_MUSBA|nr:hypothetical protein C4D60_Mb00t16210 [Musa balbisiana]